VRAREKPQIYVAASKYWGSFGLHSDLSSDLTIWTPQTEQKELRRGFSPHISQTNIIFAFFYQIK
jgi:hypothetical protein